MKNRRGICGFVLLPECTSYKLPPFSPSLIFPFSSVISYVLLMFIQSLMSWIISVSTVIVCFHLFMLLCVLTSVQKHPFSHASERQIERLNS